MSELLKLAERCEKATGPDSDINCAISIAVGDKDSVERKDSFGNTWMPGVGCVNYTGSIDAAMTLVPPTADMERPIKFILQTSESGNLHWASIKNWKWGVIESTACKSLPLALSAAALRARAATPSRGDVG